MLEEKIYNLVEEKIARIGFELVRVKYFDKTKTLQIMIDSRENTGITLENCSEVSKEMSVLLDIENLIPQNYVLEVSSPGIDRPLVKLDDFKKYRGQRIKLLLKEAVGGIKKYKANIKDTREEIILLDLQGSGMLEIPFDNIQAANLLVSETI
jgi:ribosome maturation factor RimP